MRESSRRSLLPWDRKMPMTPIPATQSAAFGIPRTLIPTDGRATTASGRPIVIYPKQFERDLWLSLYAQTTVKNFDRLFDSESGLLACNRQLADRNH
jgi:hypothetical protein